MSGGLHGKATRVLSACLIVIGVALIVRTLAQGGGAEARGLVVGVLFIVAGAGRLWLATRSGRT
jgi:hypothetical protein